ncbi:MAG: hypothetical protein ACYTAF_17130 [Planctomycetota bacterium]
MNDNAIDLSGVVVGDIVVTADDYKGIITVVNNGADTLTIGAGWISPAGIQGRLGGTIKPTDGQAFRVHRISLVTSISITSDPNNTQIVYVGRDGNARTSDYPLQPGESVGIADLRYVDVTRIYVIAASGNQTVNWILGAPSGAGNYGAVSPPGGNSAITWITFTDADATPSVANADGGVTANTGATTITNLDGATNKRFVILFNDGNTTIQDNANINLQGAIDFTGAAGDTLTLVYNSTLSAWFEVGRSLNS